jgi:hypothetical protein
MQTECTADFFGFEPVEGREVIAAFDAGAITSDAPASRRSTVVICNITRDPTSWACRTRPPGSANPGPTCISATPQLERE